MVINCQSGEEGRGGGGLGLVDLQDWLKGGGLRILSCLKVV